ncbi:MAG: hypothetical protein KAT96_02245 [Candidatus Omnitrophica bacterium]|nr:hypothetical protein [Candidatus Omnitrophota bacterium]
MRKSVILTVVIGIMLVILALAVAAVHFMTQESCIAEHKIKRIGALYAAQAGMVLALDQLRKGVWSGIPPGRTYCLNGGCAPPFIVLDGSIPYEATMRIFSDTPFTCDPCRIEVEVNY